ncbi:MULTISPECIES: hypothetical protein [Arthrobacter]|uniref:hypothetical protein n=1 Tax=Arthrobacter TaxID=1663 RepID=UPI0033986BE4
MSQLDNLGRYGEFAKNADLFIKQISDAAAANAVGDAAPKLRGEGAVIGIVVTAAAAGGIALYNHQKSKRKAASEERRASQANATEKLKALFKKGKNPDDPGAESGAEAVDSPE